MNGNINSREWGDVFGREVSPVGVLREVLGGMPGGGGKSAAESRPELPLAVELFGVALKLYPDDDDRYELVGMPWKTIAEGLVRDAQAACTKDGAPPCMTCKYRAHHPGCAGGPPMGGPQEPALEECDAGASVQDAWIEGHCPEWWLNVKQEDDDVDFLEKSDSATEHAEASLWDAMSFLASQRAHAANLAADVEKAREEWEYAHAELIAASQDARQCVLEMETEIRERVLAEYEHEGRKPEVPGLGIRVYRRAVYDLGTAVDWAIERGGRQFLSLNTGLFEKHARAVADTMPLEFVEITNEPVATISNDLAAYIDPDAYHKGRA